MHEDQCLRVPSHRCDVVLCLVLQGQAFEMLKFELWLIIPINISKRILLKLRRTFFIVSGTCNSRLLAECDLFSHVTIFVVGGKEVWGAVDLLDQLECCNVKL